MCEVTYRTEHPMTTITIKAVYRTDGTYSAEAIRAFIADHLDLHDSDHYRLVEVEVEES